MIRNDDHAADTGRLVPGLIYELTTMRPVPQGAPLDAPRSRAGSPRDASRKIDARELELRPDAEPIRGYRLISRIGQGHRSEVWKAEGPCGLPVALKFTPKVGDDAADLLRSFSLMKDVRHANLIKILGGWELAGHLVVAMELADARLVDRRGSRGGECDRGIPLEELAAFMEQAARGIDFLNRSLHAIRGLEVAGLLHGDIRPQDFFLVGGSIKVGGFRRVAPLDDPAQPHVPGCRARADAPAERVGGRPNRRSDQYGLARAYCRLGARSFSPTSPQTSIAGGHDDLSRELDLSIFPESQRAVLARALADDPGERWPDCLAFVQELARCGPRDSSRVQGASDARLGPIDPPPARPDTFPGLLRGRRVVAAAGVLILVTSSSAHGPHRGEEYREAQGLARSNEAPSHDYVPAIESPETRAIGVPPSDNVGPSPALVAGAEPVEDVGAMTAFPRVGTARPPKRSGDIFPRWHERG